MVAWVGINMLGGFWPLVLLWLLAFGYLAGLVAFWTTVACIRVWNRNRPLDGDSLPKDSSQSGDAMRDK